MRYILKALQKLSALDLVPSKVGGCFPRRLVLSSTGVVTGGADVDADMMGRGTGTGVTTGVEIVIWGVANDDNDAGLLVIP